jgi:hypothetical protein
MSIKSVLVSIESADGSGILDRTQQLIATEQSHSRAILRWGLIGNKSVTLELCSTLCDRKHPNVTLPPISKSEALNVALVIPTGVGASTGGFIGDSGPIARAFEAIADRVVIHPNVVNGADFYGGGSRSLYVDGYTLDRFFAGEVRLGPPAMRRIGLLLDVLDEKQQCDLLNAANATRAVWGIDLIGYTVCREQTRGHVQKTNFGHFTSEIENPEVLYEGAEVLRSRGAEAIAVVTATEGIPEEYWFAHYVNSAPNPIGTLEALISRAITWKTGLPCAHAPAFLGSMGNTAAIVDPRAAAEVASRTGLPCILRGLANAPLPTLEAGLSINDLSAIIIPFECAGGMPALAAERFGIPLIAVRSNHCVTGVCADQLGLTSLTIVSNYPEALAFTVSRKAGISWESLTGPISSLSRV